MAQSFSHKFGQLIGELLELAIEPHLRKFSKRHNLFLDMKGPRKARKGNKVSWTDSKGNKHDLDFVLERKGSEKQTGAPVAFIECAWRRYTKHSRNRAQEIQGAILPLVETFRSASPFAGVVLAGEFTNTSLTQLKSLGFGVLYFPYSTVVKAFAKYGIDASSNERTSERDFKRKVVSWNSLIDKSGVAKELLRLNRKNAQDFFELLSISASRFIQQVVILPLHGAPTMLHGVKDAIDFISGYEDLRAKQPLIKYEIIIKYNNTDKIEASFVDKKDAIIFLEAYL
jgi:hypothetical protein